MSTFLDPCISEWNRIDAVGWGQEPVILWGSRITEANRRVDMRVPGLKYLFPYLEEKDPGHGSKNLVLFFLLWICSKGVGAFQTKGLKRLLLSFMYLTIYSHWFDLFWRNFIFLYILLVCSFINLCLTKMNKILSLLVLDIEFDD